MVLIKITAKWWFNSFKSTEFGCFLQRNSSARFESGAEATVAFVFSEQFFRLMWHRLMCFDFFLFQTWNYTLFIHLRLSSTSSNGTHECVNCSSWISWLIGVIGRNWAQLGHGKQVSSATDQWSVGHRSPWGSGRQREEIIAEVASVDGSGFFWTMPWRAFSSSTWWILRSWFYFWWSSGAARWCWPLWSSRPNGPILASILVHR